MPHTRAIRRDRSKRANGIPASLNGIQLQLWATWLLYALLVDLTDAVAEALRRSFRDLSLEVVSRGLYHFAHACRKGPAHDPIEYFARKAQAINLIKAKRPKRHLALVAQVELSTIAEISSLVTNILMEECRYAARCVVKNIGANLLVRSYSVG